MDFNSEQPLESNFAIKSWLISLAIGLFTFYIVRLWIRVKELPPGPMPLPFLGNLLKFYRASSAKEVFLDCKRKYGGIYTLWMCDEPIVVVADWELAKEGLITKRNDIISRPSLRSLNHMRKHFMGIVMEPNTKNWEVSRKVAAGAVRKFAYSERLATIVNETTGSFITKMLQYEKPVNPAVPIQELIINIITETAFGSGNVNAEEMKHLTSLYDTIQKYASNCPGDVSTLLLLLYYKRDEMMKNMSIKFGEFLSQKFNKNKETFQRGEIRNFSDAVLTADLEANEENKDSKYLDDDNMMKIIGILYLAGTETSATSLRWIMLLLAYYAEAQKKLREEIDEKIGQRMPLTSDRKNCNYTWAFISESLRFRPAVPIGVPHRTNVDTELGGTKIRKGTNVIFHAEIVHMDPEIWEEPTKFMPERFLDSKGKYRHEKLKGFLGFGEGKRICVGEKLARNDLFLLLANLVQRVEIEPGELWTEANLEGQSFVQVNVPKPYTVSFIPRNQSLNNQIM